MADSYGFDDDYIGTQKSKARQDMLSGQSARAGIGGVDYIPVSAAQASLQNRPQQTTQSGTQTSTQSGTQTTSQEGSSEISFTGKRPEKFDKPVWDEGQIKKRAAEIAAPQIRQLRQAVQQALVKHYENPNVRKMMVRSALQGYGIGLGSVKGQATSAAGAEYARKYSFDMQAAMADFNSLWQEYLGARKTTTKGTSTGETTGTTTGTSTGVTDYKYMGGTPGGGGVTYGPPPANVGGMWQGPYPYYN